MLFKSMGVAAATHSSANSEDYKPITLRLSESEVQLYDVAGKTMGLNRQDFLSHLIRSSFRTSFTEFLIGYTESSPAVSLLDVMFSHAGSDGLLKGRIKQLLESISREIQEADEAAIQQHFQNGRDYFEYAQERDGIFTVPRKPEPVEPNVSEGSNDD